MFVKMRGLAVCGPVFPGWVVDLRHRKIPFTKRMTLRQLPTF